MFLTGSFNLNLGGETEQTAEVISRAGKLIGYIKFKIATQLIERNRQ